MLIPIVGAGRVRARVTADVDFTMTESTSENYNPQTTSLRSEQTAMEQRMPGDTAQGIPGALSNQPPNTAGAPPAAQQQPAPAAPAAPAAAGTARLPMGRHRPTRPRRQRRLPPRNVRPAISKSTARSRIRARRSGA